MSKYMKTTTDLNDVIHDLKYTSLLDWGQSTYHLPGCTVHGGDPPFLRPSTEDHSSVTGPRSVLRKETLNSSFLLEKPIQLASTIPPYHVPSFILSLCSNKMLIFAAQ